MSRDPPNPFSLDEIGKRLLLLRQALDNTQWQMAALAGVTDKAWQNYEAGIRRIDIKVVGRLRATVGVTSDWVYWGDIGRMPGPLLDKLQGQAKIDHKSRRK
jgi:transcriptional regulator with XRE-family HTH domain